MQILFFPTWSSTSSGRKYSFFKLTLHHSCKLNNYFTSKIRCLMWNKNIKCVCMAPKVSRSRYPSSTRDIMSGRTWHSGSQIPFATLDYFFLRRQIYGGPVMYLGEADAWLRCRPLLLCLQADDGCMQSSGSPTQLLRRCLHEKLGHCWSNTTTLAQYQTSICLTCLLDCYKICCLFCKHADGCQCRRRTNVNQRYVFHETPRWT